jgi:hypothetical protein
MFRVNKITPLNAFLNKIKVTFRISCGCEQGLAFAFEGLPNGGERPSILLLSIQKWNGSIAPAAA